MRKPRSIRCQGGYNTTASSGNGTKRAFHVICNRGAITSFVEVINQASEVVMTLKVVNIIAKRMPAA
jgi:hypothetical protein